MAYKMISILLLGLFATTLSSPVPGCPFAEALARGGQVVWENADGTEIVGDELSLAENSQLVSSGFGSADQEIQSEQSGDAELTQALAEAGPSAKEINAEAPLAAQSKAPCKVVKKVETIHKAGETIIHKPSRIIVNQPPTRLIINHPPLIVKPSPVFLNHGGRTIHKHITHKFLPRPVHVRPVYVELVKPIEKKVLIEKTPIAKPAVQKKTIIEAPKETPCAYSAAAASASAPASTPVQVQVISTQQASSQQALTQQALAQAYSQGSVLEEEAPEQLESDATVEGEWSNAHEWDAQQGGWETIDAQQIGAVEEPELIENLPQKSSCSCAK